MPTISRTSAPKRHTPAPAQEEPTILKFPGTSVKAEEEDDHERQRQYVIREHIRDQMHAKLLACAQSADTAMSERDAEDYVAMGLSEASLRFARTETEKTEAIFKYQSAYIPLFLEQTKAAGARVLMLLKDARKERAISLENMEEWKQRLKNGTWLHTKAFIEEEFPSYVANWKAVAAKRRELLKHPAMATVKKSKLLRTRELETFLSGKKFLNVHYFERMHLVGLVESAILASDRNMLGFAGKVESQLRAAATGKGRYLHGTKVGKWLQLTMQADDQELFYKETLLPYLQNWHGVRSEFDNIEKKLNVHVPRGFNRASLDTFLLWTYEQRQSYIEEAGLLLGRSNTAFEMKEGPEKELEIVKVAIRHDMTTGDWEGAEIRLREAREKYPRDFELASMERFLQSHRTDKKPQATISGKERTPSKTMREMNALLDLCPTQVRDMLAQSMARGYGCFRAVCGLLYNRIWIHNNVGFTEKQEKEDAKNDVLKMKTEEYARHGHTKFYEKNIIEGSTEEPTAMRGKCTKPQVTYTASDKQAQLTVVEKADQHQHDESFIYWTSVIPKDLSYNLHENVVRSMIPKLKSGLRSLEGSGIMFERSVQAEQPGNAKKAT